MIMGAMFDVFMAYSTVCPLLGAVTALIVILLCVGVLFSVGALTAAPMALLMMKDALPVLPA